MSIVITGNPGVGKHTIANEIAKRLGLHVMDINTIAKNSGLFEEKDDTNDVDIEKLEKILEQQVSKKNVIVGHLAPHVLRKEQVGTVIVLRQSPYDLISVYKNRGYSDKKIRENTESEILGVIAHDSINRFEEKNFQVDTTKKTILEVIEKVIQVITEKKGDEKVDWLELVRKNNDLGKFFVD